MHVKVFYFYDIYDLFLLAPRTLAGTRSSTRIYFSCLGVVAMALNIPIVPVDNCEDYVSIP